MRHSCLWSTITVTAILLLNILCPEPVSSTASSQGTVSTPKYKVNEVGRSEVHGHACGREITAWWNEVCSPNSRKRRSMFLDEKEALSFLQQQIQRHRRSTGQTDIVEECCHEGCALEEVAEYCY